MSPGCKQSDGEVQSDVVALQTDDVSSDARTLRQCDIVRSLSTKQRLLAEAELFLQQSEEGSSSGSRLGRTQNDWTGP